MQLPEPSFSVMPFGGYEPSEVDAFIDELEAATATTPPTIGADRVRAASFRQAKVRGYATAEVDQWLDLVANALGAAGAAGVARRPPTEQSARPSPVPSPPTPPSPSATPTPVATGVSSDSLVGVVQQRNGLPKPVLLGLISAVLVVIVVLMYVFA